MSRNKDPAVLFYTEAYLVGTKLMTYEQKGKYMDLLCLQHQQGHLSEDDMLAICGERDPRIFAKFLIDENGLYYNERMEEESIKRKAYTDSRHQNGSYGGRPKKQIPSENHMGNHMETICLTDENHMGNHMRNRNINIDTNTIKDIIEYLNTVLGTKYKYSADYIKKHINARLSEGYTLEDFKTVIDKKFKSWSGTEMAKYLRPETLFGTKFASYLNELEGEEKKDDRVKEPYRSTELYGEYFG